MRDIREIVTAIIDGSLQESETIELKQSLPHNLSIIAKNIVGIANCGGGYLVVGVIENSKNGVTLVGVDNVDKIQQMLSRLIAEYTLGIQYTLHPYTLDSKNVILLRIEKIVPIAYYSRRSSSPERLIAYARYSHVGTKVKDVAVEKKSYTRVYKYMTIEAFLVSLYAGTWRFYEPNKWSDKYERRFYCADYQIYGAEQATPQLFATCVTRNQNSEAAWKVYSHGQGLSSHCVQLELDIDKLRTELRNKRFDIVEKSVEYKHEKYILELHNKGKSKDYTEYFSSFSIDKFLKLLILKRDAYSYENEVRIFAIPKENGKRSRGNKCQSIDLAIDWSKVIRKVRIDKACTDAELISVRQACFSAGINPCIKGYQFIGNIHKPENSVDIEFELYDIDAMPGKSRIVIK